MSPTPPAEGVLPREREEKDEEREQAELLGGRREIRERAAPQQPARAEINQAQQRVKQKLPLVIAAVNPAGALVHFESEPDAESQQQQNVLRLRPQQPRQGSDANPPEQKSVRRARDDVVNLSDERDVREKQTGTNEMQRLAGLSVFARRLTQPPAARMKAEHEQKSGADFHAARNLVPVRGNQQRDSRRDEHGADDGDDGEEFVAAILLELEVFDDFQPLLIGDEPGLVKFLNVSVFHFVLRRCRTCSRVRPWDSTTDFVPGATANKI